MRCIKHNENIKFCIIFIFIILVFILIVFTIILFSEQHWEGFDYPARSVYNKLKIKEINDKIKNEHIHGIKKLNIEVCHENLALIHEAFKKYNIPFWLSEGTALGFFRDNKIIPWDDDVDIGFKIKYLKNFSKKILPYLISSGFIVSEIYRKASRNFVSLIRKNEKIDIDIIRENKGYGCTSLMHKKVKNCDSLLPHLNDFTEIKIRGKIYNLPKIGYIKELYGNKWNIPIKIEK